TSVAVSVWAPVVSSAAANVWLPASEAPNVALAGKLARASVEVSLIVPVYPVATLPEASFRTTSNPTAAPATDVQGAWAHPPVAAAPGWLFPLQATIQQSAAAPRNRKDRIMAYLRTSRAGRSSHCRRGWSPLRFR